MNMIKTSLALALASLGLNAQAAHFQIVGPSSVGGYVVVEADTLVGSLSEEGMVEDLSGEQALLGFGSGSESTSSGPSYATYDWVREVTLDAATNPAAVGFTIGGSSIVAMEGVPGLTRLAEQSSVVLNTTLKIASDGEAAGSAIRMLISGSASSVFASTLAGMAQDTTFSLVASWADQTVSYTGNGIEEAFNLSLDTVIGAEISLSLSYFTAPEWTGSFNAPLGNVTGFGDNGLMSGTLSLAPVPEPEQYALLLAGLGLIGCAARRRA